jgi:hypothetical protein
MKKTNAMISTDRLPKKASFGCTEYNSPASTGAGTERNKESVLKKPNEIPLISVFVTMPTSADIAGESMLPKAVLCDDIWDSP